MKRRTLDILFSIGGLGIAALLLVAGLVLTTDCMIAEIPPPPKVPAAPEGMEM